MEVMPFGKFKGQPFANMPGDYLDWLLLRPWPSDLLRQQVEQELSRRAAGTPASVEPAVEGLPAIVGADLARAIVQAGRQALAEQYPGGAYPDLALALDATAELLTSWALEVFK